MAKRRWLELAELGSLLLGLLGILLSLVSGLWQIPLVFIWAALGLNFLNRLQLQQRLRRQSQSTAKLLENRFAPQFQELQAQIRQNAQIKAGLSQLKTKEEIQQYLGSLEKSLTNVVQYLNQEALDERIRNLEQELLRLRQESLVRDQGSGTGVTPSPTPLNLTVGDPWDAGQGISPVPLRTTPQQRWQPLYVLAAHKDCVSALGFSEDNRLLASGSWDRQLKIWQVGSGKQLSQVSAHDQGLLNLQFLDGTTQPYAIASSSFEPDVKVWQLDLDNTDIPQLTLQERLIGHQGAVYGLTTTPTGHLLTASHDQTICQWDPQTAQTVSRCFDPDDQIQAIATAPTGNLFITGGTGGILKFWRSDNHQLIGSLGNDQPEAIAAIAIRPDGQLFVSGGDNGTIYLWQLDLNTLETLPETVSCFSLPAHDKAITHLLFNPQGNFLVSSSVDGTICIWQLGVEAPLATLQFNEPDQPGVHGRLLALALSADGRTLAAGGSDGRIKVWQQATV